MGPMSSSGIFLLLRPSVHSPARVPTWEGLHAVSRRTSPYHPPEVRTAATGVSRRRRHQASVVRRSPTRLRRRRRNAAAVSSTGGRVPPAILLTSSIALLG